LPPAGQSAILFTTCVPGWSTRNSATPTEANRSRIPPGTTKNRTKSYPEWQRDRP
jgi:hypothetical protein